MLNWSESLEVEGFLCDMRQATTYVLPLFCLPCSKTILPFRASSYVLLMADFRFFKKHDVLDVLGVLRKEATDLRARVTVQPAKYLMTP